MSVNETNFVYFCISLRQAIFNVMKPKTRRSVQTDELLNTHASMQHSQWVILVFLRYYIRFICHIENEDTIYISVLYDRLVVLLCNSNIFFFMTYTFFQMILIQYNVMVKCTLTVLHWMKIRRYISYSWFFCMIRKIW